MENTLKLDVEFEKIWNKIESGENIAFMRHGDGERAIMEGRKVRAQEGWESPSHITKLGIDCLKSLDISEEKVWYGISCPCCDSAAYYWYMSRIKNPNITFANLWVNSNYRTFINKFKNIKRDAVVIANHRAVGKQIGDLNILKYYPVSDNCIEFWEKEADVMLNQIKEEFGEKNNIFYVVSAGPMAGPMIAELYKNNPNNCYIDFGSSIDSFFYEEVTRPYMIDGSEYSKQKCWMHNPQDTNFDVTVVCTLYKRPENLIKQLEALENQTLRPKEILLFQDGISNYYRIEILDSLKERFDNIKICIQNIGVWGRFDFARTAKSPYVCLFDDDTIPGKRWLENCYNQMQIKEGVYGTLGIVLTEEGKYPLGGFYRVGWCASYSKTAEVDFVGHSWFMKREYLDYMFEDTEEYQKFKYVAEDMCLSTQCQKHGIKTYVPPHPYSNQELWGSLPVYAKNLGASAGAVSQDNTNYSNMTVAIKALENSEWKPLYKTDKKYVENIYKGIIYEKNKSIYKEFKHKCKRKLSKIIKK